MPSIPGERTKRNSGAIPEILAKNGLVYSEKANLSEVCSYSRLSTCPVLKHSGISSSSIRSRLGRFTIAGRLVLPRCRAIQVLCKPKLMPIKSITLQKLERLEKAAASQEFPGVDMPSSDVLRRNEEL